MNGDSQVEHWQLDAMEATNACVVLDSALQRSSRGGTCFRGPSRSMACTSPPFILFLTTRYTVPIRSIRQGMLRVTQLPKFSFRHLAEMTVTSIFFRQTIIFLRIITVSFLLKLNLSTYHISKNSHNSEYLKGGMYDSDLSVSTLINLMTAKDANLPATVGTRRNGTLTSLADAENVETQLNQQRDQVKVKRKGFKGRGSLTIAMRRSGDTTMRTAIWRIMKKSDLRNSKT